MQGESPLRKLKHPTLVYMTTCRLSSCITGVYNVHLLIILERGCSSMYRKRTVRQRDGHGGCAIVGSPVTQRSGPFAHDILIC